MASTSQRIFIVFASLLGTLLLGVGVSAFVVYKPFGVHDLEREKYDKILREIAHRQEVEKQPRAVLRVVDVRNPDGLREPSDHVSSVIVLKNDGALPLEAGLSDKPDHRPKVKFNLPFPIYLEPGESTELTYDWQVPDSLDQLVDLETELFTNDPLQPTFTIKPYCEIAKPFILSNTEVGAADLSGRPLVASAHVFSQMYDGLFITDLDPTDAIDISAEPERNESLLSTYRAKSGLKLTLTHAPGRRVGEFSIPIRFTVAHESAAEQMELTFKGRVKSTISFYSPDIDVRTGLSMGVIKIGTTRKWTLFSRIKGEPKLDDVMVEVKPEQLVAHVNYARKGSSDFKIVIALRDDATPFDFQAAKQGYLKVSRVSDPSQMNWLPLHGTIVPPVNGKSPD